MQETINKDDWNFIFDESNPEFESDFNSLLKRYLDRASNTITSNEAWKKYDYLKKISTSDTWIADMNISEKDPQKEKSLRYYSFFALLNNIGMMDDYFNFFGKSQEQEIKFLKFYAKMLKAQKERKAIKEKKQTLPKLLTKLTGAVSGFRFISKIRERSIGNSGKQMNNDEEQR